MTFCTIFSHTYITIVNVYHKAEIQIHLSLVIMPPPLIGGGIKRCFCLSICLTSVCRVTGPKSRTERPRKTKIGTEVAHVTCDSGTTFKVKRSKVKVTRPLCSPPCWRVSRLQRWARERFGCGKLLLRCRLLGGGRRFGAYGAGEWRVHTVAAARLQFVFIGLNISILVTSLKQMQCLNAEHTNKNAWWYSNA